MALNAMGRFDDATKARINAKPNKASVRAMQVKARCTIGARFPKGGTDPMCKTVAMRAGGPTGRADDDFGAKECRMAYDKAAGRK